MLNVLERTVGKTLRHMNYYVQVACKKSFSNCECKQARLRWARERRYWNKFVLRKKIFVDEMKLTIGQGAGRSLVQCPPGAALEDRYLEPSFPDDKSTSAKIHRASDAQALCPDVSNVVFAS